LTPRICGTLSFCNIEVNMQYGIYIDENRCMGCFACVVACKDWHDLPAGPASWMRIKTVEKGSFPHLFVAFLPQLCYHCAHPSCLTACPVGAISKRPEDGIVVVDREICLGRDQCGQCLEACPYEAPQFGPEEDPRMQKCDLCLDRLIRGEKPVCVLSCPMEAITVGPLESLRADYGDIREAEGFDYSEPVAPSIIFRPKVDAGRLQPRVVTVKPRQGKEKEG
jgi:anaerobic dimethyl sulfoxide reductase subunit B